MEVVVEAQGEVVVPGEVEGGGGVCGGVEDAAGEGGAGVGFADAGAPGAEEVVEVDEAVVGGAAGPAGPVTAILT